MGSGESRHSCPDVRIVTFEFSGWQGREGPALDLLDLLGLDSDGRLVVAELKRGAAPDTIEMQAIKYAAFASRFTPEILAESHAAYLTRDRGVPFSATEAQALLEEHAGGALDPDMLRRPRIVLLAASFGPQVTASAVWLTEMGLDLSLVQFNAYRTENDLILTVARLWPVADVEEFTVSPRQAELREVEERVQRRREANAVTTLIADGSLPNGASLILDVGMLPVEVREPVTAWIAEDPQRGRARWHNDVRSPLVWEVDGSVGSAGGLAKEIIRRATGERPPVLRGPRVWLTPGGSSLSSLAGIEAARDRDWSDLHGLLTVLGPGEWTTYGDLAQAIGSAARAVGQHVTSCRECPTAYRVLNADDQVAREFRWSDPYDVRDPRVVLEEEGVRFISGLASEDQRVSAVDLARRASTAPAASHHN